MTGPDGEKSGVRLLSVLGQLYMNRSVSLRSAILLTC
jgi:hypothetical protein